MRYSRVSVMVLSNNTFCFNVPLVGEEAKCFEEELTKFFQERGESFSKPDTETSIFFDGYTELNREELEEISNGIIGKIIQGRKHAIHSVSVK